VKDFVPASNSVISERRQEWKTY